MRASTVSPPKRTGVETVAEDVARALAPLLADGFDHYEHEHFKPGVRVRNRGEQYVAARQWGTAEVVAVLRKPGTWERQWGRLNIEVLVRRDRADFGDLLAWWADYGTRLPEGCWACGDGRLVCAEHATPPAQRTPEADHTERGE